MRRFSLLGVVLIAACASSASSRTAPGATNSGVARVSSSGGTESISTGAVPIAGSSTIYAPIDRLWGLLPGVYDSVGIPLTVVDRSGYLLGNRGLQVRRQLHGVMLSKYIDCGYAQGRPSADFYDVNLSVTTQLQPQDSLTTTVITTVDAVARPVLFTGEYNHCGTRGELETRISNGLKGLPAP
jgi:hypothetical protein